MERRMVATVSLGFMQKIIFLDRDALLLCVEAGAVGASLEEQLRGLGVTLGHEPDSLEFSTVGGWVATRASGGPSANTLVHGKGYGIHDACLASDCDIHTVHQPAIPVPLAWPNSEVDEAVLLFAKA